MENDKTCPEHVTVDLTGVGGWEDFGGVSRLHLFFRTDSGKTGTHFGTYCQRSVRPVR